MLPGDVPLLADLYAFNMVEAYLREGLLAPAVFSLFVRRLPPERRYLVACGLEQVLEALERYAFDAQALDGLRAIGIPPRTLDYLAHVRFTGDVFALEEGTPFFAGEPVLEVVAPLPEAQLVEAWVINQIHVQSLAASKAARIVRAARGRRVVDFGLRRMQGADAALKVARASYLAGLSATSNVLAGICFGIPVSGTMAHSYVQVHRRELDAFRAWTDAHRDTVLLVDTYDTLAGVDDVIRLVRELGDPFRVSAIRLDSGDLLALSHEARRRLDAAGLVRMGIFASGNLDEHEIDRLLSAGAPISGFGVGTALGVSSDAPSLDLVYKLVAYAGSDRTKLSPHKVLLPGRKQVFRFGGANAHDVVAGSDEVRPGQPLLRQVMRHGRRCDERRPLSMLRARAADQQAALPGELQGLGAGAPYPVEVSAALQARFESLRRQLEGDAQR